MWIVGCVVTGIILRYRSSSVTIILTGAQWWLLQEAQGCGSYPLRVHRVASLHLCHSHSWMWPLWQHPHLSHLHGEPLVWVQSLDQARLCCTDIAGIAVHDPGIKARTGGRALASLTPSSSLEAALLRLLTHIDWHLCKEVWHASDVGHLGSSSLVLDKASHRLSLAAGTAWVALLLLLTALCAGGCRTPAACGVRLHRLATRASLSFTALASTTAATAPAAVARVELLLGAGALGAWPMALLLVALTAGSTTAVRAEICERHGIARLGACR
mmetsp:Transcript_148082/g.258331  ORF Transcript_148082/g.258331 Transcript_148082/m.258331 type:complete len:272 (+) Transcript_148082:225-1040(+)